jgi:hypothetical protein
MPETELTKKKKTAPSVAVFGLTVHYRELDKRQRASLQARIFGLIGGIALIVSWFLLNIKAAKGTGDLIGNLGWLSLAIAFYNWLVARNIPRKQTPKEYKKN